MDRVSNSTVAKRPFCFWSACHAEKEAGQEEAEDTKTEAKEYEEPATANHPDVKSRGSQSEAAEGSLERWAAGALAAAAVAVVRWAVPEQKLAIPGGWNLPPPWEG